MNCKVTGMGKLLPTVICRAHALPLQVSPCIPIITENEVLFIRLKYHYTGYTNYFHFLIHSNSQPITLQQKNCHLKKRKVSFSNEKLFSFLHSSDNIKPMSIIFACNNAIK